MPGADDYEASDGGPAEQIRWAATYIEENYGVGTSKNRLLDGLAACVTRAMASPQRADVQDIADELSIRLDRGCPITAAEIRTLLEAKLR